MPSATRRPATRPAVPAAPTSSVAPYALLPLRLFLGVTFTFAGLQKLANPDYLDPHSATSVQATILSLRHQSPIGPLLGLSAHAPALVGVLIALGELAVGIGTLVGLWVRLAAAGGLLLSLTFFLTVSFHTRPYYYGSDIVFVAAWTVPLLAGAWPGPTLDRVIRRRAASDADPQRRALVLGGAGAVGLAAASGLLAAATAAVGRALHTAAPAPAAAPSPRVSNAPSPTASTRAKLPGTHLVAAKDLPPGHGLQFTDPNGDPAWVVRQPDGSVKAFSAVCTHAGCTVGLAGNQFVCPCHGGVYSAATGQVLGGPPPSPLPPVAVRVEDGDIRTG